MKIWQLNFDVDNYENFIPKNNFSIEQIQSFDGRSIKNKIKYIPVKKMEPEKKLDLGDAPGFILPVFSNRAKNMLEPIILNSVEFIPLNEDGVGYYAVNVIDVIDAVDYSKSKYKMFSDGKRIMAFQKYAFKEDALIKEKNIFKIVDEPRRYAFVSDKFKNAVEINNLKGFVFKKVWDNEETL